MTPLDSKLPDPYPFQERVANMIAKNGATYMMHDMSLGKTRTCIMAIKKLGMPVMVLAPLNAALITWPNELDKWAPELNYVVLHGPHKEHRAATCHNADVIIMNFEGLYWWYDMVQKKKIVLKKYFIIWDESSLLKNPETKRWMIMDEAMPIWSPYRVCLSGTPMPSQLEDLWGQYYLLDNGKSLCREIWQFRSRWFNWNPDTYTSTPKIGAKESIFKAIAPITDRLGEQDWMNLPPEIHNNIELELPNKLRRLYEQLEQEFLLEFPNGIAEANSKAVLNSKLRQFLQGGLYIKDEIGMKGDGDWNIIHDLKIKQLKSVVETSAGNPVLAPIQFKFEYDLICKEFRYQVPVIAGLTSATRTAQLVSDWNKGKLPLLVVHPRSVAFSLNLQFGGHIICWVALPWESDLYSQLLRRLRRPGQKAGRIIIHRIVFKDTVDERVGDVLASKLKNQEDLFDAISRSH